MDPHKIIQELIDPPPQDKQPDEGKVEKALAQRKIDIEVWLKNKITIEKLRQLEMNLIKIENKIRDKTFDFTVDNNEIRLLTIKLTALKDVRDLITNFE